MPVTAPDRGKGAMRCFSSSASADPYYMEHEMTERQRVIAAIFLLASTALFCTLPLFIKSSLPYGHDTVFHVFQAAQFDRALHEGFLYPRWVADSMNGYGSANFIFYSPLAYYFTSLIHTVVPSLILSMVIAIWWSFFLSGITMFLAAREIFGAKGSLLSGVIYQMLPFHLIDLYQRGTYAELFAFLWFPLLIFFMSRFFRAGREADAVGLSVSYAGLILTHLVSAFIFSLVISAYLLYYFITTSRRATLKSLFPLVLGLGLSSVYLVPVFLERKFVHIDYLVQCVVGDFRNNFLFLWNNLKVKLHSFYLLLHIGTILEVLFCLIIAVVIRRRKGSETFQSRSEEKQQMFFIGLFVVAFFLTTPLSMPLWAVFPGFPTLQFPWRWLPVMELSLSLLMGSIFSPRAADGTAQAGLSRKVASYSLFSFLAVFGMILTTSVIPSKFPFENINTLEYTPVWALKINEVLSDRKVEKVSAVLGAADLGVDSWESERRAISVAALSPVRIRVATFYYPGWAAYVDGVRAGIDKEEGTGVMMVNVPQGRHTLILRFQDIPLRYYAKLASLVALLITFLVWLLPARVFAAKKRERTEDGTDG
jgi:hypothetical protein